MCQPTDADHEQSYVKLLHCGNHDTFHLWVGKATVHLTPRELLLIGGAINSWWQNHPEQLKEIQPFDMFSSNTKETP
ncbi:MAG: hypothetical protein AAGB29_00975 [Planctomycetota bacterium]